MSKKKSGEEKVKESQEGAGGLKGKEMNMNQKESKEEKRESGENRR